MQDISGFGLIVSIAASNTFPAGFVVTQFADDQDPLDSEGISIGNVTMGLNGDMIFASAAKPLPCTLNVIPGSDDDNNLSVIASNNRVGRGKNSARDIITISIAYPNGATVNLTQGKFMEAPFVTSVASAGRMKTKTYKFMFENSTNTLATNP